MGEADFKSGAKELHSKVTAQFEKEIKELQDSGVKISTDDFIFKNWDPMKDYTIDMYKK